MIERATLGIKQLSSKTSLQKIDGTPHVLGSLSLPKLERVFDVDEVIRVNHGQLKDGTLVLPDLGGQLSVLEALRESGITHLSFLTYQQQSSLIKTAFFRRLSREGSRSLLVRMHPRRFFFRGVELRSNDPWDVYGWKDPVAYGLINDATMGGAEFRDFFTGKQLMYDEVNNIRETAAMVLKQRIKLPLG
jgi:hypothetical protein